MKTFPTVIIILSCACISLFSSGCIVVKAQQEQPTQATGRGKKSPEQRVVALTPKPNIEMSDELVRSEVGDMVSVLPAKWFLLNTKTMTSPNVFAVVVNHDYTLGLVYSTLRKEDGFDSTYLKQGILGITKISLNKRERKAPVIKSVGQMEEISIGTKRFGAYRYTTDNGSTLNRVAVFRSSMGNYYECTLTEFTFTGRKVPARNLADDIYVSVLSMIDY